MKFLLERFDSLTAYTRLILLGSLLLAVVCLFLSALYGYLAAGEQYLRYLALSEGLLEASWPLWGRDAFQPCSVKRSGGRIFRSKSVCI